MPDAFPVQLVSPEQVLFDGEAEMVVCRPVEGAIAFLNGHVPYLGALADDEVRIILPGDGEEAAALIATHVMAAFEDVRPLLTKGSDA